MGESGENLTRTRGRTFSLAYRVIEKVLLNLREVRRLGPTYAGTRLPCKYVLNDTVELASEGRRASFLSVEATCEIACVLFSDRLEVERVRAHSRVAA